MTHRLGVNGTDLGFMVTSIGPMVCGLRGGLATHTSADVPRPAPTPAGATHDHLGGWAPQVIFSDRGRLALACRWTLNRSHAPR